MIRTSTLILATLTLGASASAQVWQEGFTGGSNDGAWEIYWVNTNQLMLSGGNPGEFLRIDTTTGSLNCHFLEIFPTNWPAGFSGDWRAAGIDTVGLDVNLIQGSTTGFGEWRVKIANDNGTPGNDSDDCWVEFNSSLVPPFTLPPQNAGWQSFDFSVPSASTTVPPGWTTAAAGTCGLSSDAIWNSVITNVSYFRITMDTDPNAFCLFTAWDLGVDNLRVGGSAPVPFCFGDGSGTGCPCGNSSAAGEGCANSSGVGGVLDSGGTLSVGADNLTFSASQLLPGQPALLFVGVNAVNGGQGLSFGDGLRCAGGSVIRLGVQIPDAGGNASWGPGLGSTGGWAAGDTRHFQGWYRDPIGSPCSSFFNLTQGLTATMAP